MVFRKEPVDVHHEVMNYLSEALTEWKFKVEQEPRFGTVRPDVVAFDTDGAAYVFEVKTSEHQGHLGAIGQLEAYKRTLEELGHKTTAVLLTSDEAPGQLKEVAREAGVVVLGGFDNKQRALQELLSESFQSGILSTGANST
jgi:hypothetical protein